VVSIGRGANWFNRLANEAYLLYHCFALNRMPLSGLLARWMFCKDVDFIGTFSCIAVLVKFRISQLVEFHVNGSSHFLSFTVFAMSIVVNS